MPPTPPYGFQESDGGWILETEEGSTAGTKSREHGLRPTAAKRPTRTRRWYPAIAKSVTRVPRTRRVPRPTSTAMGPIARQRMWRKLRASSASTYIIITPGDREIEEIDSSATYPYDERYDFDECFPPCPEDDSWVGSLANQTSTPDGLGRTGRQCLVWSAADGGWRQLLTDPADDIVIKDYADLPGWTSDCFECPPWGWTTSPMAGTSGKTRPATSGTGTPTMVGFLKIGPSARLHRVPGSD